MIRRATWPSAAALRAVSVPKLCKTLRTLQTLDPVFVYAVARLSGKALRRAQRRRR